MIYLTDVLSILLLMQIVTLPNCADRSSPDRHLTRTPARGCSEWLPGVPPPQRGLCHDLRSPGRAGARAARPPGRRRAHADRPPRRPVVGPDSGVRPAVPAPDPQAGRPRAEAP